MTAANISSLIGLVVKDDSNLPILEDFCLERAMTVTQYHHPRRGEYLYRILDLKEQKLIIFGPGFGIQFRAGQSAWCQPYNLSRVKPSLNSIYSFEHDGIQYLDHSYPGKILAGYRQSISEFIELNRR